MSSSDTIFKQYDVVKLTWSERAKVGFRKDVIVLQYSLDPLLRYRFLYRDGNKTYLQWLPASNFTKIEKQGSLEDYSSIVADIADYALDESWEIRRIAKRLGEEYKRLSKQND